MKITVTRSGGFAGLSRTWSIVVDDQPDSEDWVRLIDSLPWGVEAKSAPQPDRFSYRIQCSHRRVTLSEHNVEGPWRELVDRIQDRASD